MNKGIELFEEINKVRTNPKDFVSDVKLQLNLFEADKIMRTKKGETVKVIEGKDAWINAISFLQQTYPLKPLVWCPELCYMSSQYESHLNKGQEICPFDLLKRHYSYNGNISFNTNHSIVQQTPRDAVISMIIDDGQQNKGNRKTIFDSQFFFFGGFMTKRQDTNIASMYFSDINQFKVLLPGQQHKHTGYIIQSPQNSNFLAPPDKVPTRRTRKSSFSTVNGQVVKIIQTTVEYEDGTSQKLQQHIERA